MYWTDVTKIYNQVCNGFAKVCSKKFKIGTKNFSPDRAKRHRMWDLLILCVIANPPNLTSHFPVIFSIEMT